MFVPTSAPNKEPKRYKERLLTSVGKIVETVSVSAIADHWHQYKLTRDMRYVCVSGLVRYMFLSPRVTCDVTLMMMISHPSDDQVAWSH